MASMQQRTLKMQLYTATQTAVVASLSPLATQVTIESTVSALSSPANGDRPSKPKEKQCERHPKCYRRMSPSTRCALFQIVCQHSNEYEICSHPNKLSTPTKTRFDAQASRTERRCLFTFTWCPSHSGFRGNEL